MNNSLVSVIIVNYNGAFFLKRCINSILNQAYKNIEIIFIDNNSTDGSFDLINKTFKINNIIKIKNNHNAGYAGGANQGIKISKGEYILLMNPDVILEHNFISECLKTIKEDDLISSVSGKLIKYDFKNDKVLNIIDSTGIMVEKSRRAIDRGQNMEDRGQFENIEPVFGVCGAAAFYRKSALDLVKINGEYFDEDFFAYKEDIDLSWRLNLYGFKCLYNPRAIAYHARGLGGAEKGIINFIKNRKHQSKFLRGISFRNHCYLLIKNETSKTLKSNIFYILIRAILFLGYAIIFEQFLFQYFFEVIKNYNKMKEKREYILKTIVNITEEEQSKLFL